jgi:hypothetical protein
MKSSINKSLFKNICTLLLCLSPASSQAGDDAAFGSIRYQSPNGLIKKSIYLKCMDSFDANQTNRSTEDCKKNVFIYKNGRFPVFLSQFSVDANTSLSNDYLALNFKKDFLEVMIQHGYLGQSEILNNVADQLLGTVSDSRYIDHDSLFEAIRFALAALIEKRLNGNKVLTETESSLKTYLAVYESRGWRKVRKFTAGAGEDDTEPASLFVAGQAGSMKIPEYRFGFEVSSDTSIDSDDEYYASIRASGDPRSLNLDFLALGQVDMSSVGVGILFKIDSGYLKNRWALALAMGGAEGPNKWMVYVAPFSWGRVYQMKVSPLIEYYNIQYKQNLTYQGGLGAQFQRRLSKRWVARIEGDVGLTSTSISDEQYNSDRRIRSNFKQNGGFSNLKSAMMFTVGRGVSFEVEHAFEMVDTKLNHSISSYNEYTNLWSPGPQDFTKTSRMLQSVRLKFVKTFEYQK